MQAGQRYQLSGYGIWGYALLSSASLRDALTLGLRFLDLTFAFSRIRAHEEADGSYLLLDDRWVPAELKTFVVLRDASMRAAKPQEWAGRAVALYHEYEADCIVAEVNQGGEMVTAVLQTVDPAVPVREVRASRGKWLRAEPVAALYAQGRVVHAMRMPELEDEMCDFGPEGLSGGRSPDRVDALVWAVSELLLGRAMRPRIRNLS